MLENPEVMFGTSGLVKSEGLPQHVKAKGRDRILLPKGQSYMERMISEWSEPLIRRHSAGANYHKGRQEQIIRPNFFPLKNGCFF